MPAKSLKKILVAEDEVDVRSILEIALVDVGGFTVKLCCSGIEALQYAEEFNPDLILLDMMMPGLDGMETLKELRKKGLIEHVPIIFLTAKTQAYEINIFRSLGALDVITKPFDPMTLAEILNAKWNQYYGE